MSKKDEMILAIFCAIWALGMAWMFGTYSPL